MSLVPKEKNAASLAISWAVIAARGSSIIVPIRKLRSSSTSWLTSAIVSSACSRMIASSFTSPTSGTMISGCGSRPALRSCAAASAIARTWSRNSPGTTSPSRTPRMPSIGFCSWCRCTSLSSSAALWSGSPTASATATLTDSSVRSGRNSCSGGSSSRTTTGSPSIAPKMPRKSSRCSGSSSSSAFSRSSSVRDKITRSTIRRREPRNMCSVRHSPMPWAPKSRARWASSGLSALARTPIRRVRSAWSITAVTAVDQLGVGAALLARAA